MRRLYKPLLALSAALATGALWTVGQTGPRETNVHLCEFVGRYIPGIPADCSALDLVISIAGWGFVLSLVLIAAQAAWIVVGWRGWRRTRGVVVPPGLEIHFDPRNPARRFWSLEAPRDRESNQLPGAFHEYRAGIYNPTMRTIRNVSVTVEHVGDLGVRPVDAPLDKTGGRTCDLKPGCAELAVILRWPHPKIQAGMLAGPSALCYGPIVVTASGDDIPPTQRVFWFDYQHEPMIFDKPPSPDELSIVERPIPY